MGLFQNKKISENKTPNGKWYKLVSTLSMIVIFLVAGIVVLCISGYIKFTSLITGGLIITGIVCIALISMLPWIRRLENHEFKKTAITFIIATAVVAALWIVSVCLLVSIYRDIEIRNVDANAESFVNKCLAAINFVKYSIILYVQLLTASFIATYITKYKKNYMAFQVIAYLSYLFYDVWITLFLNCVTVAPSLSNIQNIDDIFGFNQNLFSSITTKGILTILLVSVVYMIISNTIIKKLEINKVQHVTEDLIKKTYNPQPEVAQMSMPQQTSAEPVQSESIENKLTKLKAMYDKQLISQEEYEKKKEDLLSKM